MREDERLNQDEFDKSELDSKLFDGFADTSNRRYIYISNLKTGITRWSKNAVEDFGLSGEYVESMKNEWAEHIHPEDRQAYIKDIKEVFQGKKSRHSMDYRVCTKNGEYVICTCTGNVVKGAEGEADLFMGSIENHGIIDNVDAVTNLYNLYQFWQHLKLYDDLDNSTVLLIGINNFSEINNTYGYSLGNEVLRQFADLLRSEIKDRGRIYRSDGARFVCILEGYEKNEIQLLYKAIKKRARHNIYLNNVRIAVTISCGAVPYNDSYDENSLQTSARYAYDQSKNKQHGDLVFFDSDFLEDNKNNLKFMSALRSSILNHFEGFYLCYQPIMGADDEKLIGAEALLRWYKEPFGNVPPGVFIPWLENEPSFYELGNWIIRQALTEAKPLVMKYPDFVLNVNITYTQLSHTNFRKIVDKILRETGFPPDNLCFELTERCRQLEKQYLYDVICYLKQLGIRIAIDDFGTGFSSLNLLGELPIDVLKIDRGFVQDIETNCADQAIVKAVTGCADDLNVHVCLEGLEDRSVIDFVKRYSVYSYQGFYFSKPIPMKEFVKTYGF